MDILLFFFSLANSHEVYEHKRTHTNRAITDFFVVVVVVVVCFMTVSCFQDGIFAFSHSLLIARSQIVRKIQVPIPLRISRHYYHHVFRVIFLIFFFASMSCQWLDFLFSGCRKIKNKKNSAPAF